MKKLIIYNVAYLVITLGLYTLILFNSTNPNYGTPEITATVTAILVTLLPSVIVSFLLNPTNIAGFITFFAGCFITVIAIINFIALNFLGGLIASTVVVVLAIATFITAVNFKVSNFKKVIAVLIHSLILGVCFYVLYTIRY